MSEAYLQAWHARHPGACRVFVEARDADGRSSYERLAALAEGDDRVLDVACGDGWLLSLTATITRAAPQFGIDMSVSELSRARARLPDAKLLCARAQALPVENASVDLVLCHMALMLMDEPERVLDEVRRVLTPGGRFSAITNRAGSLDPIAKQILVVLRPLYDGSDEQLRTPPLGDSQTLGAESLLELAKAYFAEVTVESVDVTQPVDRRDLLPFLVDSIYGFDAISSNDAIEALDHLDLPDPVPWTVSMLHVRAGSPRQ